MLTHLDDGMELASKLAPKKTAMWVTKDLALKENNKTLFHRFQIYALLNSYLGEDCLLTTASPSTLELTTISSATKSTSKKTTTTASTIILTTTATSTEMTSATESTNAAVEMQLFEAFAAVFVSILLF